jgi:hypothetical protein
MAYVPPARRITTMLASGGAGATSGDSRWAKSVKPEHKTISISSMEDFPALGGRKVVSEPKKDTVISHSVSLADKLKKKMEDEKKVEEERTEYEKEMKQKALEYEKEYAAIQARSLHKKLYRTYGSDVSGNEYIDEKGDETMFDVEENDASFEEE